MSNYANLLSKGKCPRCGRRPPAGTNSCIPCRGHHNRAMRKYYTKNRDRIAAQRRARRLAKMALETPTLPQEARSVAEPTREWLLARLAALGDLGASKGLELNE
jgi:hypothetical protein